MDHFIIQFLPDNIAVKAKKGETILACAVHAGVYINSSCGGDGVCGRCKVIVRKGNFKTQPTGRITHEEKKQGYVLACLTTIQDNLEVLVPPESRLDLEKVSEEEAKFLRLKGIYSEVQDVEAGGPIIDESIFVHSPLATKIFLKIPPPTLDDKISDLERLYREIRRKRDISIMQTGLANIKRLGNLLRESKWQITVTLGKRNETTEIVLIEPGDTSNNNFGIAFDIGTTTVTGQLVDLNTKKIIGTKSTYNRQAVFGSDVISRIIYASEEDGLDRLHHAVIDNINEIIKEHISPIV
ncbi:MAG: 2Fe-2S iron-sulfur cluster-binding protein [Candidatus Omnitrophica bacterium]|nr:2Fe-2S iron-sulfur cluster-binding protein [Candidatus Omnitrophota bacterium]